ncbi:uncharacterized protein TNCV_4973521 [Trichonephila clavipes]|uniref:Uncharacterized protein n=1 Tax=Trichonephila clavipes TaxID=2585209 RepID=A0A8X6SDF0_TRICX|nr:uncharacterized protein TNCV_4973521 [Trichonephila clavipes]
MGLLFVAMLKPIRSSAKCYCGFVSLLIKCRETDAWAVSHRKKIVGATTSEHCLVAKSQTKKYKGLSNEVLNTIKPTYLELCTKELLTKCLHGKTQNSNECLNGVIWQRVPKEVFVCLKILKSGALDAVINLMMDTRGCVEIFKKLNITPGYFTLKGNKHLDINRINDAERHSTPNVKSSVEKFYKSYKEK